MPLEKPTIKSYWCDECRAHVAPEHVRRSLYRGLYPYGDPFHVVTRGGGVDAHRVTAVDEETECPF